MSPQCTGALRRSRASLVDGGRIRLGALHRNMPAGIRGKGQEGRGKREGGRVAVARTRAGRPDSGDRRASRRCHSIRTAGLSSRDRRKRTHGGVRARRCGCRVCSPESGLTALVRATGAFSKCVQSLPPSPFPFHNVTPPPASPPARPLPKSGNARNARGRRVRVPRAPLPRCSSRLHAGMPSRR